MTAGCENPQRKQDLVALYCVHFSLTAHLLLREALLAFSLLFRYHFLDARFCTSLSLDGLTISSSNTTPLRTNTKRQVYTT